jgi:hypothetical protein
MICTQQITNTILPLCTNRFYSYIGAQSRTKDKFGNTNENRSCTFSTHASTQIIIINIESYEVFTIEPGISGASFNQEHNNPFSPRANSKEMSPPIQKGKNVRGNI